MSHEPAERPDLQDEPIPPEILRKLLDDPKVQRDIEEALDRARRGDGRPGSSPEDLRARADEERRRLEGR